MIKMVSPSSFVPLPLNDERSLISLVFASTDGKAMVKLVPSETLRAARDAKAALAKEKADRKAASAAAAEQKRLDRLEKGRLSPSEMFKPPTSEEFSEWDEAGLPLKDKEGVEIAKSRGKKLKKEWDMQKKYVSRSDIFRSQCLLTLFSF